MDNQDLCDRRCGDELEKIFGSAYIWPNNFLNEAWILVPNEEHDNIGQQAPELPLFDTSSVWIEREVGFELQKS